jgi:hypothetical protein
LRISIPLFFRQSVPMDIGKVRSSPMNRDRRSSLAPQQKRLSQKGFFEKYFFKFLPDSRFRGNDKYLFGQPLLFLKNLNTLRLLYFPYQEALLFSPVLPCLRA